jgi:hypothetical protein
MLLYSYAGELKPVLGHALDAIELTRDERIQLLTQLTTDGDDEHYPMLDLSRQDLRRLPEEIDLVRVREINIGSQDEPLLYKEINLGYNPELQLTDADFDRLNHFEAIHFISSKMNVVPPAIARLTNAIMLNFSWSSISEFPDELYGLVRLRGLKFNWTSIARLSPKIAQLKDLVFIEVAETPFAHVMHRLDEDDTVDPEAREIRAILRDLNCEIDE